MLCSKGGEIVIRILSGSSICTLPLAVGSCTAPSSRFYYDAATGEIFVPIYIFYKRAQRTAKLSFRICFRHGENQLWTCPIDPCQTSFSKNIIVDIFLFQICHFWRTDFQKTFLFLAGKCSRFTYSGCGGNPNNFQSLASCQATCGAVGQYTFAFTCILSW